MIQIPITTKFDDVETEVVVKVRKMQLVSAGGGKPRVVLDDYDVVENDGTTPIAADVLDANETLVDAVEEIIEETLESQAA